MRGWFGCGTEWAAAFPGTTKGTADGCVSKFALPQEVLPATVTVRLVTVIACAFGFVIRTGTASQVPGTRPLTLPSIVNSAGEPFATFHLYFASGDLFPAPSTATTENWCCPLFVVLTS